MVEPLRKRTRDGKLYKRRPAVEEELKNLEKLELKEVIARAREGEEKDKPFLSSEALWTCPAFVDGWFPKRSRSRWSVVSSRS
jgi:hypothetical protein